MRIFVGTAAFVGLCLPISAQPESICPTVGELAASIMEGRQNGVVMSAAMNAFPEDNAYRGLAVELVKEAYRRPQFSTTEHKANAVTGFRNDAELTCYTSE